MSLATRLKAVQPIILALLLAVLLRAWAVTLLPEDFDEPIYLQVGFDYAASLRAGDLNAVIDYPGVVEHPAFVKLLYSAGILALGDQADWLPAFYLSRSLSALFSVLAVAFLAIGLDPLAAGMLAVHTLAIKYGSQVYLEAVPQALTIGAVLAFLRTDGRKPNRWFWLSAIALGIATASKYSYIPVIAVVLLYIGVFDKKLTPALWAAFCLASLAAFLVADVSLWRAPIDRLLESLTFHIQYSQGAHVQQSGYPWFQPLVWILSSSPAYWHPEVFFYYGFDAPITLLAFAGLRREYRERRWLVVWLGVGLLFLLLWPTKWPQYALSVTAPLCILAAGTLRRAIRWVQETDAYWKYLGGMLPNPGRWFWMVLGAFALFVAGIYLSAAIKLASGKVGWSNMTAENSGLPSNAIHDLLPLPDGRVLIATDRGAAYWTPPADPDGQAGWTYITSQITPLVSDQVLSLAADPKGGLWFGTTTGLSRLVGGRWTSYLAADLGLADGSILSLLALPDGRLIAGTLSGASMWDGENWDPVGELQGQAVFSLAGDGTEAWFGTSTGMNHLHLTTGDWSFLPSNAPVKHILLAADGGIWIGTAGAGLARWRENSWTSYRTGNSGIPFNDVNWITETEPGQLWVATSAASDVGGAAATFDGLDWHSFLTDNSGASGAEPVVIVQVAGDSLWLGTRTRGIDIYQLGSKK